MYINQWAIKHIATDVVKKHLAPVLEALKAQSALNDRLRKDLERLETIQNHDWQGLHSNTNSVLADLLELEEKVEQLEKRVEYLDKITPRFFSEPLVLNATGDDLDSVGVVVGIPPRGEGESDDTYRKKILEKAYTEKPWIGQQ